MKAAKSVKSSRPPNSRRQSNAEPAKVKMSGKRLHPNNPMNLDYDFEALIAAQPKLKPFVKPNPYGTLSVDFSDPQAVRLLNCALLAHHYGIRNWDIPNGFLCPAVPGRADYLNHLADLLAAGGKIPRGQKVSVLDIGTGANGIYPLVGHQTFGWRFVASDIDPVSLENFSGILVGNQLADHIELR
ncbi:MAG: RlmF-related methyltransferase, partial [Shewanella sp.]|nr:RlmF-related methyltransferase [Shewanella sp.]